MASYSSNSHPLGHFSFLFGYKKVITRGEPDPSKGRTLYLLFSRSRGRRYEPQKASKTVFRPSIRLLLMAPSHTTQAQPFFIISSFFIPFPKPKNAAFFLLFLHHILLSLFFILIFLRSSFNVALFNTRSFLTHLSLF